MNAYFTGGGKVPITLASKIATEIVVTPDTDHAMDYFLERYSAFGRAQGVQAWLVYMPCKARALEGQFEWSHSSEALRVGRIPQDLPETMKDKCERNGLRFLDLTPALVEESRRTGQLLYNHLFDSHLNGKGSEVVANVLAESLERVEQAEGRGR